jgi:hypothetical protein
VIATIVSARTARELGDRRLVAIEIECAAQRVGDRVRSAMPAAAETPTTCKSSPSIIAETA